MKFIYPAVFRKPKMVVIRELSQTWKAASEKETL